MGVVPECTSLVWYTEPVLEGIVGHDRTLRDGGGSISPAASVLEKAVPVLQRKKIMVNRSS